ncbi:lipopolysaccharide biosynthesis protein [Calditrichota bacterium]
MNLARHAGMISWAVAARGLPLLYGLVFIIVVIPHLHPGELGTYYLVFQTYRFIALLNMNLVLNPMLKLAAEPMNFHRYISAGLAMSVLFNLICAIVATALAGLAAGWFRMQPADLLFIPLLLGVFILRDFGFFVQQTIFRTGRIFFIEAIYFVGSAFGMIALIQTGEAVTAHALLQINVLAAGGSSVMALIFGTGGIKLLSAFSSTSVKELLRYGLKTVPIGFARAMMEAADAWVLGVFYNPSVVGIYGGARRVYQVLYAVTQSVGMLAIPAASKYSSEGKVDEVRSLFEKGSVYLFLAVSGFATILFFLAEPLYQWMGDKYAGSLPLLRILLIGAPFDGLFTLVGGLIYGVGAALAVSYVSLAGLGLLIILLVPGVYFFSSTGAAIALVLTMVFSGVMMFYRAAIRFDSGLTPALKRFVAMVGKFVRKYKV